MCHDSQLLTDVGADRALLAQAASANRRDLRALLLPPRLGAWACGEGEWEVQGEGARVRSKVWNRASFRAISCSPAPGAAWGCPRAPSGPLGGGGEDNPFSFNAPPLAQAACQQPSRLRTSAKKPKLASREDHGQRAL